MKLGLRLVQLTSCLASKGDSIGRIHSCKNPAGRFPRSKPRSSLHSLPPGHGPQLLHFQPLVHCVAPGGGRLPSAELSVHGRRHQDEPVAVPVHIPGVGGGSLDLPPRFSGPVVPRAGCKVDGGKARDICHSSEQYSNKVSPLLKKTSFSESRRCFSVGLSTIIPHFTV